MIGMRTYGKFKKTEEAANKVGLRFGYPRYSSDVDMITLFPLDDKLPCYSRDAALFTGTLDDVDSFLCGYGRAMEYLLMIKATNIQTIEKKEQSIRNHKLINKLGDDNE